MEGEGMSIAQKCYKVTVARQGSRLKFDGSWRMGQMCATAH